MLGQRQVQDGGSVPQTEEVGADPQARRALIVFNEQHRGQMWILRRLFWKPCREGIERRCAPRHRGCWTARTSARLHWLVWIGWVDATTEK